jgi:alkylation response protein AidB-like acyl-CoA dehydrogenase
MSDDLSEQHRRDCAEFEQFAREEVAPLAAMHDREQRVDRALIARLAARGYLASCVSPRLGGRGLDMVSYGLLHEAIGHACSSVRSLLTVHDMVTLSIARFGSEAARDRWLPRLTTGTAIGALAITEPAVGSDPSAIEATATRVPHGYRIDGRKTWITFGQIADVYLVLATAEGRATAVLVEADRSGFSRRPLRDVLGTRGSMLGALTFDGCEVPDENLLGREGFGLCSVAQTALGLGRYSVACGSVGIAQAALDASLAHSARRVQFGKPLNQHQLIQRLLADMVTNVAAARLLCLSAGRLKDAGDVSEVRQTFMAKYFATRTAMQSALDAVQIHGASGCGADSPVGRYLRDAKVMEIIEGSTQLQQVTIARLTTESLLPATPQQTRETREVGLGVD